MFEKKKKKFFKKKSNLIGQAFVSSFVKAVIVFNDDGSLD